MCCTTHTNTDKDPDVFVKGTLPRLVVKWLVGIPQSFIPLFALRYLSAYDTSA